MGKSKKSNPFKDGINLEESSDTITPNESSTELSALDLVRAADAKTKTKFDDAPVSTNNGLDEDLIKDANTHTGGRPTKEKLRIKFATDKDADKSKAVYCQRWAELNNCHFLGFSIKSDEPMFKEIK